MPTVGVRLQACCQVRVAIIDSEKADRASQCMDDDLEIACAEDIEGGACCWRQSGKVGTVKQRPVCEYVVAARAAKPVSEQCVDLVRVRAFGLADSCGEIHMVR